MITRYSETSHSTQHHASALMLHIATVVFHNNNTNRKFQYLLATALIKSKTVLAEISLIQLLSYNTWIANVKDQIQEFLWVSHSINPNASAWIVLIATAAWPKTEWSNKSNVILPLNNNKLALAEMWLTLRPRPYHWTATVPEWITMWLQTLHSHLHNVFATLLSAIAASASNKSLLKFQFSLALTQLQLTKNKTAPALTRLIQQLRKPTWNADALRLRLESQELSHWLMIFAYAIQLTVHAALTKINNKLNYHSHAQLLHSNLIVLARMLL